MHSAQVLGQYFSMVEYNLQLLDQCDSRVYATKYQINGRLDIGQILHYQFYPNVSIRTFSQNMAVNDQILLSILDNFYWWISTVINVSVVGRVGNNTSPNTNQHSTGGNRMNVETTSAASVPADSNFTAQCFYGITNGYIAARNVIESNILIDLIGAIKNDVVNNPEVAFLRNKNAELETKNNILLDMLRQEIGR